MNAAYGSSLSFGSKVRSKPIGHNTYSYRRINFRSKPTPIHGPVHISDLNYSYSRSHFSRLPQAVAKELLNRLSHKVSYTSMKIDIFICVFTTNEVRNHLHICDHSIIPLYKRGFCLGFSNTSHVESLDRFRKSVFDKVKLDICIVLNVTILKNIICKYNMQMKIF